MTVRELIRKLKAEDPEALVLWCDHDGSADDGDYNAPVGQVDAPETEVLANRFGTAIVVLRP